MNFQTSFDRQAHSIESTERASEMKLAVTMDDTLKEKYQQTRITHWNKIAAGGQPGGGAYYHRRLTEIYQFLVVPGQRVLELGCGYGDLLAALNPSIGVGVDFSINMIQRARERHQELRFLQADVHDLSSLNEKFDVVILSDLVNDVWDVQLILEQIARLVTPRTAPHHQYL